MSAQDLEQRAPAIIDNAGKVEAHPDDAAVDRFAAALKAKLADARAKGRGGWQDKDDCPQQRLSDMLRTHVEKGDPRDVANFAMFLHQRGESILPGHQPAPVVPASEVFRIAGGDTECEPNPTPERALEVLRDLRACYDEALCDKPAPVVDDAMVGRALNAKAGNWPVWQLFSCEDEAREIMCIALTAALAREQGVQS